MSVENSTHTSSPPPNISIIFKTASLNSSMTAVTAQLSQIDTSTSLEESSPHNAVQHRTLDPNGTTIYTFPESSVVEPVTSADSDSENSGSLSSYASNVKNMKKEAHSRDSSISSISTVSSGGEISVQKPPRIKCDPPKQSVKESIDHWLSQGLDSTIMDIQKFSDTTPRPAPAPLGKSKRHSKGHVPKKLTLGPLNLSPTGISSFDSKDTALHPASPSTSSDSPSQSSTPKINIPLVSSPLSSYFPHHFTATDSAKEGSCSEPPSVNSGLPILHVPSSARNSNNASQQRQNVYASKSQANVTKGMVYQPQYAGYNNNYLPSHYSPGRASFSPHEPYIPHSTSNSSPCSTISEAPSPPRYISSPQNEVESQPTSVPTLTDKGKGKTTRNPQQQQDQRWIHSPLSTPSGFPKLEDYTNLTYLDLSASDYTKSIIAITGRLPRWIQRCTSLQYLIGCNLSITVVEEWVSQTLVQLRVLRLTDNLISTWPDHLAQLLPYDNLTVVDLEGNPCFTNFCERYPNFAGEYAKSISDSHETSRPQSQVYSGLAGSLPRSHGISKLPATPGAKRPSINPIHALSYDSYMAKSNENVIPPYNPQLKKPNSTSSFFGLRHRKSHSIQVQGKLSRLTSNALGPHNHISEKLQHESIEEDASEHELHSKYGQHSLAIDRQDNHIVTTVVALPENDNEGETITVKTPVQNIFNLEKRSIGSGDGADYSDDSSDDDALTSLEPIAHKLIAPDNAGSSRLRPASMISFMTGRLSDGSNSSPSTPTSIHGSYFGNMKQGSSEFSENLYSLFSNQSNPDVWAQKRIEPSEVEKSKVVLNLLRDIWELSTSNILYPEPDLSDAAVAVAEKQVSVVSDSLNAETPKEETTKQPKRLSIQALRGKGSKSTCGKDFSKTDISSIVKSQSYYLSDDYDSTEDPANAAPPTRSQVIAVLAKAVSDEKLFVKKMSELMSIYVKSKKCPPKAAKIFSDLPQIYKLHSDILLSTLQKCLDSYSANRDPNLDRLSSLILGNINEFRVHIPYEITLDESIRLVNYWKRLSGVDSTQTIASYGATLPNLTSYRHPDAVVAEWIQNCHRHKAHSLLSISDYLQLPVDQMKRYRNLLRRLAPLSVNLYEAWDQFDSICKEIEEERPLAVEARRRAEFDQVYNLQAHLPHRPRGMAERRYVGDAVVQLKCEVYLELPTRQCKPDAIHYVSPLYCTYGILPGDSPLQSPPLSIGENGDSMLGPFNPNNEPYITAHSSRRLSIISSFSNFTGQSSSHSSANNGNIGGSTYTRYSYSNQGNNYANKSFPTMCRSNPVPKVVQKNSVKSRFKLILHRVIIFDDVVIITDEERKRVSKVIPREKIDASLPWKYPVRDGPEALPTGDQLSFRSKSSGNSIYTQNRFSTSSSTFSTTSHSGSQHRSSGSASVRIFFHEDPKIWYCTLRSLHCGKPSKTREQRTRFVELFSDV